MKLKGPNENLSEVKPECRQDETETQRTEDECNVERAMIHFNNKYNKDSGRSIQGLRNKSKDSYKQKVELHQEKLE